MKLWKIGMALAIVVGVGCGGDPSPKDKCEDIGDLFCDRAVECIADAQGMHEACFKGYTAGGLCERAKDVTASFDSCIDQLEAISCASLFTRDADGELVASLPTPCVGVVQTATGAELDSAAVSRAIDGMRTR